MPKTNFDWKNKNQTQAKLKTMRNWWENRGGSKSPTAEGTPPSMSPEGKSVRDPERVPPLIIGRGVPLNFFLN
jgi:hypothetical protein